MSDQGNPPPDPEKQQQGSEGADQAPPPPPSYGQAPPPSYGQTPPPSYGQAPPPGYGPPPGGPGQARPYSIGDAFGYGWRKFQANIGPIVLATLALVVGVFLVQLIGSMVSGGLASGSEPTFQIDPETGALESTGGNAGFFGASLLVSMVFGLASFVLSLLIQAGIIKASLAIADGRQVDVKEMVSGLDFVQIIIAAVVVGALTTVGLFLCVLPGLAVMFFTWFTMYFLIDKGMGAIDAIKASVSFVKDNVGALIGFFLAALAAYFVGALLCGLGLLVAIPVVIIAQAYTFRTLQGEPVAP